MLVCLVSISVLVAMEFVSDNAMTGNQQDGEGLFQTSRRSENPDSFFNEWVYERVESYHQRYLTRRFDLTKGRTTVNVHLQRSVSDFPTGSPSRNT
jgi:hypothetical protein